jgi:hypothetical protein
MSFVAITAKPSRFANVRSASWRSPPDYATLIDTVKIYAVLLTKTQRKAQAELLETKAMVYAAKMKDRFQNDAKTISP